MAFLSSSPKFAVSGRCKALSLSPLSHSLMKVLQVSFALGPFSQPLIKVLQTMFVGL